MEEARAGRRAWATNANTSSFASRIPTVTDPGASGGNDGVVKLGGGGTGRLVPEKVRVMVIGLGADNDVASMRVLGWCRVVKEGKTTIWVPVILGEFSCTFSAAVGVAGAAVLETERFADTITPVAARLTEYPSAAGTVLNSDTGVLSPVGDLIGHVVLPVRGFEYLEFCFDQTTNSPTCNAIVIPL